jgi:hypothetical protein
MLDSAILEYTALLGNAMTCSILERLLPRVMFSSQLIAELPEDKWLNPEFNPFA